MLINNLNIEENEPLVVGCSSGPDSMALLHYLKKNTNNKIICCHINHNIRKQSIEEEQYLKNYCIKENIIFENTTIKKYKENNFENEARKRRYEFYEKILNKYHSKYLFLAHHGDDLIETILMKIERGSNLEGYAGIKEITHINNYYIIRPLLKYTKEDLIEYNKKNNIKYYIDQSNNNTIYTRNRYRKNILPLLKKEDKKIHLKYLKYSKTILDYLSFIEEEVNKYYNKTITNNIINIKELKKIHPFLIKNILYKYLNTNYNNQPNIIKESHIESIITIIDDKKPNIKINLPQNKVMKKTYNNLKIENNIIEKKIEYKLVLKNNNRINNHIIEKIKDTELDGNDICRLNSKELDLPLYIRQKQEKDYIVPKGMNGKKKIKEIFIEKKIPLEERNGYPLLIDKNDNILWVPNLKKTKFNKQKNEFYDIILRYRKEEEKNEQ